MGDNLKLIDELASRYDVDVAAADGAAAMLVELSAAGVPQPDVESVAAVLYRDGTLSLQQAAEFYRG